MRRVQFSTSGADHFCSVSSHRIGICDCCRQAKDASAVAWFMGDACKFSGRSRSHEFDDPDGRGFSKRCEPSSDLARCVNFAQSSVVHSASYTASPTFSERSPTASATYPLRASLQRGRHDRAAATAKTASHSR
jgi:hypothetical protein